MRSNSNRSSAHSMRSWRQFLVATAGTVTIGLVIAACGSSTAPASESVSQSASTAQAAESASSGQSSAAVTAVSQAVDTESSPAPASTTVVNINAAAFPEGQLTANLYQIVLQKAGFKTKIVQTQGREISMKALSSGDLTVSPEYVSSALEYFKAGASSPDDTQNLASLKKYAGEKGINVLTPAAATDNYAFGVSNAFAKAHNLSSLSDLATYSQKNPIVVAGIQQCEDRSYCLAGLKSVYGLNVKSFKVIVLSSQASVDDLTSDKVQLVQFDSSDGILAVNPVTILKDDKSLNHTDFLVPMVNAKQDNPALDAALNKMSAALSQDLLNEANKSIQVDRVDPADAAKSLAAELN